MGKSRVIINPKSLRKETTDLLFYKNLQQYYLRKNMIQVAPPQKQKQKKSRLFLFLFFFTDMLLNNPHLVEKTKTC